MAETIYAVATARGRAGVAILRISGPRSHELCALLCGRKPTARRLSLVRLSWQGRPLDRGLAVLFDEGASFTGEKMAEFHVHGGLASVAAIERALGDSGLARPAVAGEFTRRALENGRLDLTAVEGLADLIDAETEAQRALALRLMEGEAALRIADWRGRLVRAGALLAALLDFAEEDLPETVLEEARGLLAGLADALADERAAGARSERLREGFEVAIVGPPNVGKSTLLNRLAGREAAITSEVAGTTRDVIEVRMDLGGLAVTLLDTAGLREASDAIEREGIRRALDRAGAADLRVFLGGGDEMIAPRPGDIHRRAKADLPGGAGLGVSGKTGEGVDALLREIETTLAARVSGGGTLSRERHRVALTRGEEAVRAAAALLEDDSRAELAAEELHHALRALDSLVGKVDVEDLLDEIFRSFCIGK